MANEVRLSVLIVDDDESVGLYLATLLGKKYRLHHAGSGSEALTLLRKTPVDIMLLDILLGDGEDGLQVLKEIRKIDEEIDVVVISGVRDVKTVVAAIQDGARDYVSKPIERETLFLALNRVLERRRLRTANQILKQQLSEGNSHSEIIGDSPAIRHVKEMVGRLKGQEANVFIVGDTGTGKEMFARLIHHQENDPARPFIAVNCAAIPENLIESILFGHEKGSFTSASERRIGKFELANGGDIFLDEISCLSLDLQAKLLRVIEEKEVERVGGSAPRKVSFRVISASNDNVLNLVASGAFRKDLFYRLNTVTIHLPTLNERPEDIVDLAEYFLDKCRRTPEPKRLSPEVKQVLLRHNWRGNVRELKNTVENMVIFSRGATIQLEDIPFLKNGHDPLADPVPNVPEVSRGPTAYTPLLASPLPENKPAAAVMSPAEAGGDYKQQLRQVEKQLILQSLQRNKWNKVKTCQEMGINRNMLYRRMAQLGIEY